MRSTGLFTFLEVQGTTDGKLGQSFELASLKASCQSCNHLFSVTPGPYMVLLPGGAVVICPVCASRQATSNRYFEQFSGLA